MQPIKDEITRLMTSDHAVSNEIIVYKESDGIVYGYFNQKALDIALYERAKDRTNNFTIKNEWKDEAEKRAVELEDLALLEHEVLFKPFLDGDFVSAGSVILDLGLKSPDYSNYLRNNNISEVETLLCCGIKIFSKYSGIFTNKIGDYYVESGGSWGIRYRTNLGNTIKDDDLLFTIKLSERPKDEETDTLKQVKFSFNMLEKSFVEKQPYLSNIHTVKWLAENYSTVEEGDDVLVVSGDRDSQAIKTPFSGVIVQLLQTNQKLRSGFPLFTINPNLSFMYGLKYRFDVKKDDFTKSCIIDCEFSNNIYSSSKVYSRLGMSISSAGGKVVHFNFQYIGGHYYFLLLYDKKELKLDKSCSFLMLLDNGNILSLNPASNPKKDSDTLFQCKFQLSKADIDELSSAKFIKWRITDGEGEPLELGDNTCCSHIKYDLDLCKRASCDAFQKFIIDFKKTVEDNAPKEDIEDLNNDTINDSNQTCYVYLMIDTTNNFHKIGISNNPRYREHTLQSDKPTIELLCAKEYPSRAIAEAFEAALHRVYASKRIRGEWFNLDASDIEAIKQTLK